MADTNENKDTVLEDASTSSSERELLKLQMAFDYYKQQREEMAILGKERSSLTLQLLVVAGGSAAIFFQAQTMFLRVAVAIAIIALGVVGYLLNVNIDRTARAHMARARAARKHIGFLEDFASVTDKFGTIHFYYFFLNILIMVMGVLLIVTVFLK